MAPPQDQAIEIPLFGQLRVRRDAIGVPGPRSRKSRALPAFLMATVRPYRREKLCELFWDLPANPKAALRWALTRIRKAVDSAVRPRIIAGRERVAFDGAGLNVDLRAIRTCLSDAAASYAELEDAARRLGEDLLDGARRGSTRLDGAGDAAFASWLAAEREDAAVIRAGVLGRLARPPDAPRGAVQTWLRLREEAAPDDGSAKAVPSVGAPRRRVHLRARRIGFAGCGTGPRSPEPRWAPVRRR
ncbi:hypothetical protein [Rhodovulum sp. BSW8]|uniref:AfsR/SARP family transcriptional regulator n=1 Tax=Rhodovulum sp. BSW8 TaxID=2259645 RepID=UPI001FB426B6|nr:hypothetical protein [Rhodovulum sp. BSW8]